MKSIFNLFGKTNCSPKLCMMIVLFFALSFTACEKEPKTPTIAQIKVCNEALIGNVLCDSSVSTFDVDEPKVYVSAVFSNIDQNTLIKFTLFGQDSNGNWINILETSTTPGDQGSFDDDETTFRMNAHFTKNPTIEWVKATYMVEAEIDGEDGVTDSIEFDVN